MLPCVLVSLVPVIGQRSTHHRLDKLDAVVLRGIVGRCDHDTNPFAFQCSRPKSRDETNACEDRVEDIATAVSIRSRGWR